MERCVEILQQYWKYAEEESTGALIRLWTLTRNNTDWIEQTQLKDLASRVLYSIVVHRELCASAQILACRIIAQLHIGSLSPAFVQNCSGLFSSYIDNSKGIWPSLLLLTSLGDSELVAANIDTLCRVANNSFKHNSLEDARGRDLPSLNISLQAFSALLQVRVYKPEIFISQRDRLFDELLIRHLIVQTSSIQDTSLLVDIDQIVKPRQELNQPVDTPAPCLSALEKFSKAFHGKSRAVAYRQSRGILPSSKHHHRYSQLSSEVWRSDYDVDLVFGALAFSGVFHRLSECCTKPLYPEHAELIFRYCRRVLDTVCLPTAVNTLSESSEDIRRQCCTIECIRIVDLLSQHFPAISSRCIDIVIPYLESLSPDGSQENVIIVVASMFLRVLATESFRESGCRLNQNHYDIVQSKLLVVASCRYADPLVSFQLIQLFRTHLPILTQTKFILKYFPAAMKALIFFIHNYVRELRDIIKALSKQLGHSLLRQILELPLVVSTLEFSQTIHYDSSKKLKFRRHVQDVPATLTVFEYLLRNMEQSGSPKSLRILQQSSYWRCWSSKVLFASELVPDLLNIFFDEFIHASVSIDECKLVVNVIVDHMDNMMLAPEQVKECQEILCDRMLVMYRNFPDLIVSTRGLLEQSLSRHSEKELLLLNCSFLFLVGQCMLEASSRDEASEHVYQDTLELILLEQTSMAQYDYEQNAHLFTFSSISAPAGVAASSSQRPLQAENLWSSPTELSNRHCGRIVESACSALLKLGASNARLRPRSILALTKLLKHWQIFSAQTFARIQQCLVLLQRPSIALAAFGCHIAQDQQT